MNFFKSVFSDQPESNDDGSDHSDEEEEVQEPSDDAAWSFGGLINTIASKSESVIDAYRKDLQDFKSGLQAETAVIRQVASRAVKDLPASFEVGASVAQESLESVGQAIDDLGSTVWKGAAGIIAHGKDSILAVDERDSGSASSSSSSFDHSRRLSRFEAGLRRMQCDENTYCKEPNDKGDYDAWKVGFAVGEKGSEIMDLIGENDTLEGIYKKLVPQQLDHETFWCRYYYKLHKLKQLEEAREKLVKRALYGEEEEEDLSWDVDDDDEFVAKSNVSGSPAVEYVAERNDEDRSAAEKCRLSNASNENVGNKADDKGAAVWEKADGCESGKDSDLSVVSTQPSLNEEDLGWDEIEDIGSHDEGKGTRSGSSGSPVKVDLRKLSIAAEEDEHLSWDIEDDDEPPKH